MILNSEEIHQDILPEYFDTKFKEKKDYLQQQKIDRNSIDDFIHTNKLPKIKRQICPK
jgi:hypothetical protein